MIGNFRTIHNQTSLEEPMPGMLAIGLGDIETFHVCGVPLNVIQEQVRVVFQVPVVEGQAHLFVDP